jgi:two-component system, OmpR family, sensor histidine kinase TctE
MNEGKDQRSLRRQKLKPSAWTDLWTTNDSPQVNNEIFSKEKRLRLDRGSLFGEILDFMLAPLLLLWPLSIALTFLVARSLADAPFDQSLDDRINAISQQIKPTRERVAVNLPAPARQILQTDQEDEVYFQVLDQYGALIAGDGFLTPPSLYDFPQEGRTQFRNEVVRGTELRVAYLFADFTDKGQGTYIIQLAETMNKRAALANEIVKGVILPQFFILPLSVLLVWIGLKRGLSPITALRDQIRQREQNDLSPIGDSKVPEEIAPVIDSFNELLGRLQGSMRTQQRFIADAAHQMKTPLAGLQTQAELALRQTETEEQRTTLKQLSRSAQRTARLVTQLLALARAEHHRATLPFNKVNLTELARQASSEWVNAALTKDIDMGFEATTEPKFINGQSIVLREMMNNIIDNAIRYTPRQGTITVRVFGSTIGGIRFEVEDNGPGIPKADQALVFDRFYRVMGDESDGSGLGLAIVKEIADQHDAEIKLYSHQHDNPDRMPHGTKIAVIFLE